MTARDGKSGVVGEAISAAAQQLAAADPEQLPMFPIPTRHTGARADALSAAIAEQRRRAGRPPGSRNRATAELRAWLLSRGVDPLQQLMSWALHTPTSLAAELSITRAEAFDRLVGLWEACAPYFHARLAPIDGATGAPVPAFNMIVGGQSAELAAMPPWLRGDCENARIIEGSELESHTAQSHDPGK